MVRNRKWLEWEQKCEKSNCQSLWGINGLKPKHLTIFALLVEILRDNILSDFNLVISFHSNLI